MSGQEGNRAFPRLAVLVVTEVAGYEMQLKRRDSVGRNLTCQIGVDQPRDSAVICLQSCYLLESQPELGVFLAGKSSLQLEDIRPSGQDVGLRVRPS